MKIDLETQKKIASDWFIYLQEKICEEFQNLEKEYSKRKKIRPKYFKKKGLLIAVNYNMVSRQIAVVHHSVIINKI